MVDRRKAFSAIGAAVFGGFTGCLSGLFGSDHTVDEYSRTITIADDDAHAFNWSYQQTLTIEYTISVRHGAFIDVLLMDQSDYEAYKNGDYDSVTYYDHMSTTGAVQTHGSADMDAGSYTLLLDNTDSIGEPPATHTDIDAAVVEVDYTIIYHSG